MEKSPFDRYTEMLLDGKYGTAYLLQEFVLALYDCSRYSFSRNDHWGGFDTRHRGIFNELLEWVEEHGHTDPSLIRVAKAIVAKKELIARDNYLTLRGLKLMDFEDYIDEDGGEGDYKLKGYHADIQRRQEVHEYYVEKGYIALE